MNTALFSRWGQPLKAEATVHMYIGDIGKDKQTYEPKNILDSLFASSAEIKAYINGKSLIYII